MFVLQLKQQTGETAMQIPPRFGAIIPIIGDADRVHKLADKIVDEAKLQGLKTQVEIQHRTWDIFSSRSPHQEVRGLMILTGKDVDEFNDFRDKQVPAYHQKLDDFFKALYAAVGKPLHERNFKGTTSQYQKHWDQYSQKVK